MLLFYKFCGRFLVTLEIICLFLERKISFIQGLSNLDVWQAASRTSLISTSPKVDFMTVKYTCCKILDLLVFLYCVSHL